MPLLRSRRRRWLVDRKLQLPFVALVLAQSMLVLATAAVGALLMSRVMSGRFLDFTAGLDAPALREAVQTSARTFVLSTVAVLLAAAIALTLYALYASNRLAGPVLRIKALLAEIAAGNSSQRAAFRRRDRIDDLADILNRRVSRLDSAHNRLKAELPFLASAVQGFRAELEAGRFPLDADEVRRLETTLRSLAAFWRSGGAEEKS